MCYGCGAEISRSKCPECGFSLRDRNRAVRTVPLKPMVPVSSYVTIEPVSLEEEDVSVVPVKTERVQGPPWVDRVFLTSARALTGVSILTVLLVLTFFTMVFVKAFSG